MSQSNRRVGIWTHAAASRTLPYLRPLLRDLRVGFIRIWHLYRVAGDDTANPDYQEHIAALGGEARAMLVEFDRLGVIPYQSPLRAPAIAGKEGDMAWAVVWTGDGGEVERVALRETRGQAVEAVVAWAEAEGRIRGSAEGEDFMALRSSWTRKELRELLEEDGSCTDEAGGCVSVVEAN